MSRKRETVYLSGKLFWAKVLGPPRTNYGGDAREWTFELEPDEASLEILREHGVEDRVKDKSHKKSYEGRAPFISFKRGEFDYEGEPNDPIRIVDAANQAWDGKTELGNETVADVKVSIVDYGANKFKGVYPIAIRVLELVPFARQEFAPLAEDDPRRKAVESKRDDFERDFGLADDSEDEPALKPSSRKKTVLEDGELDDDVPVE